jgi:hypothetical protein
MEQREVRAAWEKFVEHGALSADLRSAVAASWQGSKITKSRSIARRRRSSRMPSCSAKQSRNGRLCRRTNGQTRRRDCRWRRYSLATYLDSRKTLRAKRDAFVTPETDS